KVTVDDAVEMAEKYVTTKATLAELAEEYDISIATVSSHIHRIDPLAKEHKKARGQSVARGAAVTNVKVPREDYEEIASRWMNGETLESIASDYEVSRERIRQIVKEVEPKASAIRTAVKEVEDEVALYKKFKERMREAYEYHLRCVACDGWILRGS